MSLFDKVPLAQPDPVFLTKTAFQNDKDPNKMNLGNHPHSLMRIINISPSLRLPIALSARESSLNLFFG
jgi:hypothetical protein